MTLLRRSFTSATQTLISQGSLLVLYVLKVRVRQSKFVAFSRVIRGYLVAYQRLGEYLAARRLTVSDVMTEDAGCESIEKTQ